MTKRGIYLVVGLYELSMARKHTRLGFSGLLWTYANLCTFGLWKWCRCAGTSFHQIRLSVSSNGHFSYIDW